MIQATSDPKIRTEHLRRQAVVYIRQSSPHQVRHNQESSQRQYALSERARTLGWPSRSIKTVDGDQGRNATSAVHRDSFKTLSAEIADGQVGILFSLEASRLARSNADWHRLVEICVITQTLLADEHAIYDPREPNDRLLLGVKGTISEAEMFTLRCRLHEGRWNKARRGALNRSLPVGYVRDESGEVIKDPDRQVQSRLNYIFRLFEQHKVARRVLSQLVEEKLKIPAKLWGGPRHGQVTWKEPDFRALVRLLRNPTFAGAYVYGENEYDSFDRSPTTGKAKPHARPVDEWPVCIQDFYPAYITWEQFVENRNTLRSNWYRSESRGAPRKGAALLQGIVYCGCCGARMRISHYSTKEKRSPAYSCVDAYVKSARPTCQTMTAKVVDEAVTKQFLSVVSPAKIEIALQALEQLDANRDERCRQWDLQLQQADYEVELAQRRYEAIDPENRLVAAELEARWEEALRHREQLQRDRSVSQRQQEEPLNAKNRQLIKDLSNDLERVWTAESTSMEDRKTLLRFLIKRVHLDGVTEAGKIRIQIEWHTGTRTSTTIDRPPVGVWAPKTPEDAVKRIRELLGEHDYTTIASMLNQEGYRTAKGLAYGNHVVGYIVRSRGWGRKRNNAGKRAKH